jgi:hypothetical protein
MATRRASCGGPEALGLHRRSSCNGPTATGIRGAGRAGPPQGGPSGLSASLAELARLDSVSVLAVRFIARVFRGPTGAC